MSSFEQPASPSREGFRTSRDIASSLGKRGVWEKKFQSQVEDLEGKSHALATDPSDSLTSSSTDIAHNILDLLIQSAQNPSASTSPSTPSSPSPHLSGRAQLPTQAHAPPPIPYKADQLIRLKIAMRETEHPPRPRQPLGSADPSALYHGDDIPLLGRNEGTVRFLFGPPGMAGYGV